MNEKNLALFTLETLIIFYGDNILVTDNFVEHLNGFIYENYKKHPELFSLLFDLNALEEYYEQDYEVLPMELVVHFIRLYISEEKYAELAEEIGVETNKKINDLALLFVNYVNDLAALYYAKPTTYFQKIYH